MSQPVRPGEMKRTAFISSVIDAEMREPRVRIEGLLEEAPYFVPWAFESAPASSEDIEGGYLRKVKESRVVIWLAGSRTTQPVEKEIHEALAAENCDLLAFLLPADARDTRTQGLVERIKPHARYRELPDLDQLEVEVEVAINDVVKRALAGEPSTSRADHLDLLGRESWGRCVRRWQASGLKVDQARTLANDMEVGSLSQELLPGGDTPLVVLSAEGGSGKSLATERFLQKAISAQLADATASVPIFVRARDVVGNLRDTILEEAKGLGDATRIGAAIVVDGADEAADGASLLLAEARDLVHAWPQTRMVISARQIASLVGIPEQRMVPRLSASKAREVVAIGADRPISVAEASGWSQPVKDAVGVPLFALLVGLHIARNGNAGGLSRISLLSELAEHALADAPQNTRPILRQLAVLSIARGGGRVSRSEFGAGGDIEALETSRLVSSGEGEFWFPLALMAQWFAAESLAEGRPSGDDLAANPGDLELWRFPLAILASTASHEQALASLGPIARAHPGFLSQVVHESIARWQAEDASSAPRHEAGERIRDAMACWIAGLKAVGPLLNPLFEPGPEDLPPLGVEMNGEQVVAAWYAGQDKLPLVARLPVDLLLGPKVDEQTRANWPRVRGATPSRRASWAFRWTLDELSSELAHLLNERRLPVAGTELEAPRLWRACRAVLGLRDSHVLPIAVGDVITRAKDLRKATGEHPYRTPAHPIELQSLISRLEELSKLGTAVIQPAMLEIEPSSRIAIPRTAQNDIALARTKAVYELALRAYAQLTSSLFQPLCSFMQIAVMLPARLRGTVYGIGVENSNRVAPGMQWWLEPLAPGEESQVEISLEDPAESRDRFVERWEDEAAEATQRARAFRPEQARWIGMFLKSHFLEVWQPLAAEEIIYEWLWHDLERISWVDGRLSESAYTLLP